MAPYNQMKSQQLPPTIKLKNADGTENIHYSLFYDGVPNDFKTIAEVELNETEEKKRKGLERLREILKEEDVSGIEDILLLSMLRKCKYNLKKSEAQLTKNLETRKVILEKLQSIDMKRLEHVLDHMVVGLLPYRDRRGRAILFTTPNVNLELFDVDDAVICCYVVINFMLTFPMTSIVGINYIGECKTPTLGILYPIMRAYQKNLSIITNIPVRIAKVDVLNEISIVRWTATILKPFLPAKTVGRITFYGSDIEKLQERYHPDLLPEEFGGTMGPMSNKWYKEEILNYVKRLRNGYTVPVI